ncbi:MAG: hypothetical protein K6347_08345 [Campylobacterales bacterium]
MTKARSGFMMIEVIISVILASLAAAILLQTYANNTRIIHQAHAKTLSAKLLSSGLLTIDQNLSFLSTTTYDLLKNRYLIRSDEIAKLLEEQIISDQSSQEVAAINLGTDLMGELPKSQTETPATETLRALVITRTSFAVNGERFSLYHLRIDER